MLESFVVLQGVPGDGLRNTIDRPIRRAIAVASAPDRVPVLTTTTAATADDVKLIQDWHLECRRNEVYEHEEWLENNNLEGKEERWWITRDGCLGVFDALPTTTALTTSATTTTSTTTNIPKATDQLMPGTVIQGRDLAEFQFQTTKSLLSFLQLANGKYIVCSADGYRYVGAAACNNNNNDLETWWWRVICPDGAFLRQGLELNTAHLATLQFGSLVNLKRKVINEMGLSRLQSSDDGWVSEILNPLSGQRGPICVPLPLSVPILVKVTYSRGAVIRSNLELSSPIVRHAPVNTVLSVIKKCYSEHPRDKCIVRYELSTGGWISGNLNAPSFDSIIQVVGEDPAFDPNNPGLYHLAASRHVTDAAAASALVSSSDESEDESTQFSQCLVCLTSKRNSTIVHGETGHVACCLVCARILKARGDACPVCRLPIDLVIQHFWA